MLERRERWRDDLTLVRRLHQHVPDAEHILSGDALAADGLPVSTAAVGQQVDAWRERLRLRRDDASLTPTERTGLLHLLRVTTSMRPHLLCCYDAPGMPRTNNDLEGVIRSVKTRYRRISGRTNWNAFLIRYGARVA